MKLTKDYLKEVIKEELEKSLEEQGGVNVATDMLAKAADEPMNTDAIKMVQKKLGVTADGIIGPKTVAAYNMKIKPKKPMTVPELRKLMRHPDSGAMIASMLGRKAPASAIATPEGPESPVGKMVDKIAGDIKKAAELSDKEKKRFQKLANVADQLGKAGK